MWIADLKSLEPPKGVKTWTTEDGITIVRVHWTSDPDKNPESVEGREWLKHKLVGYQGGMDGPSWKSEMDIDFSVFRGKAVYPQFNEETHVAKQPIQPIQGVPILVGWDAGLTPSCSFSQLSPTPRWLIYEALHTTGKEGIGITRFAQHAIEYRNNKYPGFKFLDYGDPAFFQKSQVDERTCAQVLANLGINIIPGVVGSKSRDEVVRVQLERMIDGKPFVQVCPSATFMIDGFKGGYQFKEIGSTKIYTTEHEKNAYSHSHEALSYSASRIFNVRDPQNREGLMSATSGRQGRMTAQRGFSNWHRRAS